jgi:hypothetical protein
LRLDRRLSLWFGSDFGWRFQAGNRLEDRAGIGSALVAATPAAATPTAATATTLGFLALAGRHRWLGFALFAFGLLTFGFVTLERRIFGRTFGRLLTLGTVALSTAAATAATTTTTIAVAFFLCTFRTLPRLGRLLLDLLVLDLIEDFVIVGLGNDLLRQARRMRRRRAG